MSSQHHDMRSEGCDQVVSDSPTASGGSLVPPSASESDYLMSDAEYWSLVRRMEKYHAVFGKLIQMGRCVFTRRISTAAVAFGEGGELLEYYWNPDYYASISQYERDFTHAHEALHVLFNHGVRAKGHKSKIANIAMDLVVNHVLVERFDFVREFTARWWDYVWVDTTFRPEMVPHVPTNESYEFYYELLLANEDEINYKLTMDVHEMDSVEFGEGAMSQIGESETADQIIKSLSDALAPEDKKTLDQVMDKFADPKHMGKQPYQPPSRTGEVLKDFGADMSDKDLSPQSKDSVGGVQAGSTAAGVWKRFSGFQPKPKPKWETIVKKRTRRLLEEVIREVEQWVVQDRRHLELLTDENFFLPCDYEDRARDYIKRKPIVSLYMDASGSVWSMAERFFKCANGIPRDTFEVHWASFDTQVYRLDPDKPCMRGSGGTSFYIIEDDIQAQIKLYAHEKASGKKNPRGLARYPDLVVMITDGYGDRVQPQHPDRWVVLLTEGNSRGCFPPPRPCKSDPSKTVAVDFYDLRDFE
jgi:hypothetical protein